MSSPISRSKKFVAAGAVVAAFSIAGVTVASAQTSTPTTTKTTKPAASADGSGSKGRMGGRGGGFLANHGDVIAGALGITTTELQTQLQSGKTIAQIAASRGVAVQKVIDAYVADERQEHPDRSVADITARVTAIVNGTAPAGGRGGGPRDGASGGTNAQGDGMGRGGRGGHGGGGRGGHGGRDGSRGQTGSTSSGGTGPPARPLRRRPARPEHRPG